VKLKRHIVERGLRSENDRAALQLNEGWRR
jgi:hypothetical protein